MSFRNTVMGKENCNCIELWNEVCNKKSAPILDPLIPPENMTKLPLNQLNSTILISTLKLNRQTTYTISSAHQQDYPPKQIHDHEDDRAGSLPQVLKSTTRPLSPH